MMLFSVFVSITRGGPLRGSEVIIAVMLPCDAVSLGDELQTFRRLVVPSSSG